ncbi:TPA: immunity 42 family protein [Enterobacter kobei]|nr:immunity 42 family protein [Enterobacter kobei]HCU0609955.1 immunity 42 family protein [Enterobacter kobei]
MEINMIFGNPYRFAIWTDYIPQWGESYKNGLFHLIINGNLYPHNIRTSTLFSDLLEITDNDCALISHPQNEDIFSLSTEHAFKELLNLAYPEPSQEDEYPEQTFDYIITSSNISESGGRFFAIADGKSLRIIGGVTERLVEDRSGNGNRWEYINKPFIEDITLSKKEVDIIMADVKKYAEAFLNE